MNAAEFAALYSRVDDTYPNERRERLLFITALRVFGIAPTIACAYITAIQLGERTMTNPIVNALAIVIANAVKSMGIAAVVIEKLGDAEMDNNTLKMLGAELQAAVDNMNAAIRAVPPIPLDTPPASGGGEAGT